MGNSIVLLQSAGENSRWVSHARLSRNSSLRRFGQRSLALRPWEEYVLHEAHSASNAASVAAIRALILEGTHGGSFMPQKSIPLWYVSTAVLDA
jgi:hypothetical protein